MRWGPEARGLGCFAGSQTPCRRPEDLPLPYPPPPHPRSGGGGEKRGGVGFTGDLRFLW